MGKDDSSSRRRSSRSRRVNNDDNNDDDDDDDDDDQVMREDSSKEQGGQQAYVRIHHYCHCADGICCLLFWERNLIYSEIIVGIRRYSNQINSSWSACSHLLTTYTHATKQNSPPRPNCLVFFNTTLLTRTFSRSLGLYANTKMPQTQMAGTPWFRIGCQILERASSRQDPICVSSHLVHGTSRRY